MNKEILKGKWKQLKGDAQKQWGKLTNDDLDVIDGQQEKLTGKLQEHYGQSKDEAEKAVDEFCKKHG
ncbi:MAG: CsbD family protein [Porticoccus sp.]|nr:CsbD family protein [Porticoccus sp.]